MKKPVIGVSHPRPARPVGNAYDERLFFSCDGLGRQTNPVIHAAFAPFQPIAAGADTRSSGALAMSGVECVTLLEQGRLEVTDSAGMRVAMCAGDVLWHGAGRGVWREEHVATTAADQAGTLETLTLWLNLPAAHKGVDPYHQWLRRESMAPVALPDQAGTVRVIAGEWLGQVGPAETVMPLQLWDVTLAAGGRALLPLLRGWYAMLLVLHGDVRVSHWPHRIEAPQLVVCNSYGTEVEVDSERGGRLVLVSSAALDEPLVSLGGLVANQASELTRLQAAVANGDFGQR